MSKQEKKLEVLTLTDEATEKEIAELLDDEEVQIYKQVERIKYRRKQYLYQLRWFKKQGAKLKEQGYTLDALQKMREEQDE